MYALAMPIETKQLDSEMALVTIAGRLVLGRDEERLEAVTGELLKQGQTKFVFDITALDYADSSGIGTLVACLTSVKKAGGDLRIAGANARMLRLFRMTGVESLMSMYPTVPAATEGYGGSHNTVTVRRV
jgi:anti-anti-sigma factor